MKIQISNFKFQIAKKSGFTLIEVVVALAIVVATLVVFGVALSTLPLTKASRNQNAAYHIAAKKMEELRNTPFASLPGSGTITDPGLSDLPSSTASLTISNYSGSADVKQVQIAITWVEGSNNEILNLETLISKNGLNQ